MKAEPVRAVANRVVIDTHVWISAAHSKAGAPAQLLQCVLSNGTAVFSAKVAA